MTVVALARGANTTIDDPAVQVSIAWRAGSSVDPCALLVTAEDKVRGDEDFVFYNQPRDAAGTVELTADGDRGASLAVQLGRLPAAVNKVVIAGSMDAGTFDAVPGLEVTVTGRNGRVIARFPLTGVERVAALVFGELYRRQDQWKFRAIGQGWDSGLAGLATHYGVAIDEDEEDQGGAFLEAWSTKAAQILAATGPRGPSWDALWHELRQQGIAEHAGRDAIRPAALHHLEQVVAFAFADDLIEQHELNEFNDTARRLGIIDPSVTDMRRRLQRGLDLALIAGGAVPRIEQTSLHLPADEILHLDATATHIKFTASGPRTNRGRLIATNAKLRFLGDAGGSDLTWGRILEVRPENGRVIVSTTSSRGGGNYKVDDAEHVAAVLTGVLRIANRTARVPAQRDSRSISPAIKAEVWRRDGGACKECGATEYLEFDHVIPWSRGGATSVGNLQLLCRGCNLRKGARI